MIFSFRSFFHPNFFYLSSYYILFQVKLLIINVCLQNGIILPTYYMHLLHLTAAITWRGTREYLYYLIYIDGTATISPSAHFLKATPFKGFAHVLQR